MKCYYDPTQDAVGSCKSCQRGLSSAHLTDLGKGLACRNRCEDDVRALIRLIERNLSGSEATSQILKRGSANGYGAAVFMLMMGAVFTVKALQEPRFDFILYLGLGFLGYGIWSALRVRRYAAIVAKLPGGEDPRG